MILGGLKQDSRFWNRSSLVLFVSIYIYWIGFEFGISGNSFLPLYLDYEKWNVSCFILIFVPFLFFNTR